MAADTTTIHPFPELRAYAESEARAYATASDGQFHEGVFLYAVVRFTVMLCDLSRPASRDAVARLVAARVDWRPSTLICALDPGLFGVDVLFSRAGLPYDVNWPAAVKLALIVRHLWPPENSNAR